MSEARATEADRLLAEGVTIEHPAGRRVDLVFWNRTMVEIERQFGSMGEFEDQLREVLRKRQRAPIFTFVVRSLDALLWNDPPAIKENRAECLERSELLTYVLAIAEAWFKLWPSPEGTAEVETADPNPDGDQGAETASSPGLIGSTSPSSDGASSLVSSGTR
jgi:hypothetical protein